MAACGEPGDNAITIYRNCNLTLRVTIQTNVGDITGSSLWFAVMDDLTEDDADAEILKRNEAAGGPAGDTEANVVDGPNRICECYFVPANTTALESDKYKISAMIQLPSGNKVPLITPRDFIVEELGTKGQ